MLLEWIRAKLWAALASGGGAWANCDVKLSFWAARKIQTNSEQGIEPIFTWTSNLFDKAE